MQDDTKLWIQELVDQAVRGTGEKHIYDDAIVEARPEWALPERLLLGKVRSRMSHRDFHWFICGEVPLDFLPGDVVASPREALRHFAMKWQLDAERTADNQHADTLIDDAEAIYALADDDKFWQS